MKRKLAMGLILVLLLSALLLPVHAQAQLGYVTDAAGLLTEQEWAELESLCGGISEQYNCGVYIVTLDDYRDYGSDVYEVTYTLYHDYTLGMGSERNGLILLLSMAERDYTLFVYGDDAEYAFNTYGQIMLEEEFLPQFGMNDWYGGFVGYAEGCAEYLALAAAGEPVRGDPTGLIVILCLISFLIALIVVSILKSGMKNVKKQTEAGRYLSGGLKLTQKVDQFTHKTVTRTKIESSSGSSRSRTGGGGSGRSGKF